MKTIVLHIYDIPIKNGQVFNINFLQLAEDVKCNQNWNDVSAYKNEADFLFVNCNVKKFDFNSILHTTDDSNHLIGYHFFNEYTIITLFVNHLMKFECLEFWIFTSLESLRLCHIDSHVVNVKIALVFEYTGLFEKEIESFLVLLTLEHLIIVAIFRVDVVLSLIRYKMHLL